MRIELAGYDRPAWLAERTTMRQAGTDRTLTVEPVPDGTRKRWPWHVLPMGPSKLLAPVINWTGKRQERTARAAMKRYLERHHSRSGTAALAPFGAGFPRQPARRASSWTRSRRLACCCRAAPDVLGEEGQDPLPEVRGGGGVVVAPLVVEEGVPGSRVDLQVVGDPGGRQAGLQHPGGLGGEVLARP